VLVVATRQHQLPYRMRNAPGLKPTQFTAMMRLDHIRRRSSRRDRQALDDPQVTIWGNPLCDPIPDVSRRSARQENVADDQRPKCSKRIHTDDQQAAAQRSSRPRRPPPRARRRRHDHVRDWIRARAPATGQNWASFEGSPIPEGVIYGYPVTCEGGRYKIVRAYR